MRRWTPLFLLAAALAAQTPDALRKLEQHLDSLTSRAQPQLTAPGPWMARLPKAAPRIAPVGQLPRTPPAGHQGPVAFMRPDLKSRTVCAIPLLAVQIDPGFRDNVPVVRPGPGMGSMSHVQPPAPACEPASKNTE